MKKNEIIKLILFPLILAGCIFSLDFFLFRKVTDDLTSYGQFYKENEDALDVVLIGNSTLREGYVPTVMWKDEGIMTRGFSSSPTHPEVIKAAIKEIINKQNPKAIFIDVNGLTFQERKNSDFFIKQYYKAVSDEKHKEELKEMYPYLVETDNEWEIFDNHNNFRQQQYWESLVYPDQFKTKGYQPNKWIKAIKPVTLDEKTILPLNEDGEYYFDEILSECQKYQNVQFIFGKMPKYNDISGEDAFKESEYMFRTIEKRLEGTNIKYANFATKAHEIGLDPNIHFKDEDHLNHLGALKFTSYFAKYLKEEIKLEVKEHKKADIDSFNQCYEDTKSYLEGIENSLKNKIS